VQLTLELGDEPGEGEVSGLPEMTTEEQLQAELEILGLDVSSHVVDSYAGFLEELGVTRSVDLLARRSKAELLVAGVKVATQTPPIRSGRRVIFLTLDDSTGPVDATFFEDAQGPYAATVFHSWLLVVRGELRRTGRRGVSLRATGCWALPELFALWSAEGMDAVRAAMAVVPAGFEVPEQRRVLLHSSGFKLSPYADIKPAGESPRDVARKLWHRSPGSAG
jgi:error-prone DNA polymerase